MCETPNKDEFHVLFECYAYVNLRNSVLPQNLVNIRKYSLLVPYHEWQCISEKCGKIFIVYVWQKKWAYATASEWERK